MEGLGQLALERGAALPEAFRIKTAGKGEMDFSSSPLKKMKIFFVPSVLHLQNSLPQDTEKKIYFLGTG